MIIHLVISRYLNIFIHFFIYSLIPLFLCFPLSQADVIIWDLIEGKRLNEQSQVMIGDSTIIHRIKQHLGKVRSCGEVNDYYEFYCYYGYYNRYVLFSREFFDTFDESIHAHDKSHLNFIESCREPAYLSLTDYGQNLLATSASKACVSRVESPR